MSKTTQEEGRAPVQGLPNEFQAIQQALLARWGELGWAKEVGLGPVTFESPDEGPVEAVAEVALEERHNNPGGLVHGGVAFSLIDTLMGAAVFRTMKTHEFMATETQTIDFLGVPTERMVGRARVDKRGRSTVYVSGEAYDTDGRMVARSTAVWAVRPKKD